MKQSIRTRVAGILLTTVILAGSMPATAGNTTYYGGDKIYFSHNFEQDHDEETQEPKTAVPGQSPALVSGDTGRNVWSNLIKRYKTDGTENTQYSIFFQEEDGNMALQMVRNVTGSGALPLRKKLKIDLDEEGKLKKPIVIEARIKCAANGTAVFANISKSGSANQNAGINGDTSAVNLFKLNINKLQMFHGVSVTKPVYEDGSWVRTKAILNPADDSVTLYVNGELAGKDTGCGINTLFQPVEGADDPTKTDFYISFFAYGKSFDGVYLDDVVVRETGDTVKIEDAALYNAAGSEIGQIPNVSGVRVKAQRIVENETQADITVKAIGALYDTWGRLSNVVLGENITMKKGESALVAVEAPVAEDEKTMAVFLWTNMEDLRPMCPKDVFTK